MNNIGRAARENREKRVCMKTQIHFKGKITGKGDHIIEIRY